MITSDCQKPTKLLPFCYTVRDKYGKYFCFRKLKFSPRIVFAQVTVADLWDPFKGTSEITESIEHDADC